MRFCSTRGGIDPAPLDAALVAGLAPDGGLYVPEHIPTLASTAPAASLAEMAERVLVPYVAGSVLEPRLPSLCAEAFAFDAPLRALTGEGDFVLELFHGPTAAFKDYAARFLAVALSALREANGASTGTTTILVATSGDTGAAVASAFHGRDGFDVVVLYPDGRVSPRQAHGLGCWGDNVRAFRVAGSFDDCQRMTKQALSDAALRARLPLTSANSISLGRLLPQAAYYAQAAATHFAANGEALGFIVPTGNLGNACACLLAWRMGAPMHGIHLATNANDVLPRYFAGEQYAPRATVATLANAMDVGAPSNFERLRYWHRSDDALRTAMRATCVDDAAIADAIRLAPQRHGIVPCPHTAAALHVLERLRAEGDTRAWAVVATAHPAKFERIVEPLIGHEVPVPPQLADCLARPAVAEPLAPDMSALADALLRTG
jgi:threonine synthase